ncbi:GmrSD restriction endonuclease domain-containing protein [Demequina sp. SO4-13]|uniref:GmrSD restriction endonuclease domain-containing protein n=1 Tax=Demequina sp. SO4-13 TaxID=3401027 RepID=UPI003AF5FF48
MLRTLLDDRAFIRARMTVVAVTAAMVVAACAPASTGEADAVGDAPLPAPSSTATPAPTPALDATAAPSPAALGTASAAARELTVKGRAPKTGYAREQFGDGWVDVDRNGCDTRNDMLRLRLTDRVMSGDCKVLEGSLADPFTNASLRFVHGGASEVDVDHLVALSDAWQKGAATWEFAKRVAFANDPLNLEPVDAGANRAKGDGDAATWLPPHQDYRCDYVARQVAVKEKYDVWITAAELDAMLRVLDGCPGHELPEPGDQPVMADNVGRAPDAVPTPPTTPAPTTTGGDALDPDMGTCKAATAAGFGPYAQGEDPEYGYYRDGDNDGQVCE